MLWAFLHYLVVEYRTLFHQPIMPDCKQARSCPFGFLLSCPFHTHSHYFLLKYSFKHLFNAFSNRMQGRQRPVPWHTCPATARTSVPAPAGCTTSPGSHLGSDARLTRPPRAREPRYSRCRHTPTNHKCSLKLRPQMRTMLRPTEATLSYKALMNWFNRYDLGTSRIENLRRKRAIFFQMFLYE